MKSSRSDTIEKRGAFMDIIQAIRERHSVRQYVDIPLKKEDIAILQKEIEEANKESGLHIQLVLNEEKAFSSFLAHYGKFRNVKNYLALIGKKADDLEEKCGYYGEKIALKAQTIGMRSCFVGGTYKKVPSAVTLEKGEKIVLIVALGYGENDGVPHRSKPKEKLSDIHEGSPEWFIEGVEAALLAPTALNQQKFYLKEEDGKAVIETGSGPFVKTDRGIVQYHFEIGSGKGTEIWKQEKL